MLTIPTSTIGRFAPSPSGPLHLGSLFAAVASFLDAKSRQGQWLVRIEDVDLLRTIPGSSEQILASLEAHGLHWDGRIEYQSAHDCDYEEALQQLKDSQRIFYCNCTRASLRKYEQGYPGTCRSIKDTQYTSATKNTPASHAIRFAVGSGLISFNDQLQGIQVFDLEELSDVIIRRRDSLFAYQLAVVVDDARQGVTSITRGVDILHSTPWQIALQKALNLPTPQYMHLPVLVQAQTGAKLSKQTGATGINDQLAINNLATVLVLLRQPLPSYALDLSCEELLQYSIKHWDPSVIPKHNIVINPALYGNLFTQN